MPLRISWLPCLFVMFKKLFQDSQYEVKWMIQDWMIYKPINFASLP